VVSPVDDRTREARRRTLAGLALAATVLGGCSLLPTPQAPPALHDLGIAGAPAATSVRLRATLALPDPTAPGWLDTTAMTYRFIDADGSRPRLYARNRWTAPPAELLGARMRARLAPLVEPGLASSRDGVAPDYVVRIELEEFSQVFDGPSTSHGRLRARATLIDGSRRATIAQRIFAFDRPAPSADAAGGAAALAAASDALIDALVEWLSVALPAPGTVRAPG